LGVDRWDEFGVEGLGKSAVTLVAAIDGREGLP